MNAALPASQFLEKLEYGQLQRHRNVTFIPLERSANTGEHPTQYLFAPDALRKGQLLIRETGRVDQLVAENQSDDPILALAGTYLRGGGQDRMLAANLVIGAHTHGPLPTRCVEHSRWNPERGAKFSTPTSGSLAASSLCDMGATMVDQNRTWDTVSDIMTRTASHSRTQRLGDAVEQSRPQLSEFTSAFSLTDGSDHVVGALFNIYDPATDTAKWVADVFGRADLLKAAFPGLVEAAALRALSLPQSTTNLTPEHQHRRSRLDCCLKMLRHEHAPLPSVTVPGNHGTLFESRLGKSAVVSHLEHNGYLVYASLRA